MSPDSMKGVHAGGAVQAKFVQRAAGSQEPQRPVDRSSLSEATNRYADMRQRIREVRDLAETVSEKLVGFGGPPVPEGAKTAATAAILGGLAAHFHDALDDTFADVNRMEDALLAIARSLP